MKQFKIGNLVWVSRFNPHGWKTDSESRELVKPISKSDIFLEPMQYVVVKAYPITRNHGKWWIELAEAANQFEHCGDDGVVTAALPGSAATIKFEMDSAQLSGKIVKLKNDFYISKRKSKLSKILLEKMQKLRKSLKSEYKYNCRNLITSCMFGIKTVSQLQKMAEKNPQDFV